MASATRTAGSRPGLRDGLGDEHGFEGIVRNSVPRHTGGPSEHASLVFVDRTGQSVIATQNNSAYVDVRNLKRKVEFFKVVREPCPGRIYFGLYG